MILPESVTSELLDKLIQFAEEGNRDDALQLLSKLVL